MKRTVFLRLGSMVLACLTVCLFAFSAEADAILRAAIDGDQAYVRTLSVIESASLTGTIPFDRASMATYLGADRSALSRELSRMQAEGILTYHRNRFQILK